MRTNRLMLSALAAIAGVAILVAWVTLGPTGTHVGEAAPPPQAVSAGTALVPSPSPIVLPSPSPAMALGPSITPTAIPMPAGDSNPGSPLQSGARYYTAEPFPIRVSFTAPSGWAGNVGGPYAVWAGPAATGDALSFQLNPKIFADPCHPEQGAVAGPGAPTASDLVHAIATRPGLATITPTSETLGGLPATSFTLRLAESLRDCSSGTYVLWELPLGATNELQAGMSERVSVVDVAGMPLVVLAVDGRSATTSDRQAIQQVLESIRFETGG